MSTTNVQTSTVVDPETDQDIDPDLDMEYDLYDETDMEVDTNPESYTLDSMLLSKPGELLEQDNRSFCRPRTTTTTTDTIAKKVLSGFSGSYNTDSFSWMTGLITLACISGFILLVLLYYTVKRPELVFPFGQAFIRILWYLLIYSAIVMVIILFIRFIVEVIHFIKVTIAYFNLMMNPLLDPKVSSLSCYFTDYVNGLIYYPAMIFYLICFVGLILFDFLILLPVLAIFGFVIGFLFSLLGENRGTVSKLVGKVFGKGDPSKGTPGMMSTAASLAGAAPGPLGAASIASGLMKGSNGADLGKLATIASGLVKS